MKMKILTISVFSILLLSSMIFSNYKHGNRSVYINVNSIVNDSLTLITKDSVFNFLKKKNAIKDSMLILDIDLNKIENELKNIDYLKMSNAFYGINSPVVIQISERNPVIEIKNDNFYLDNEGIIISKSKINSPKVIAFFGNLDSLNNKEKEDTFTRCLPIIQHNYQHFYGGTFEELLWKELKGMLKSLNDYFSN